MHIQRVTGGADVRERDAGLVGAQKFEQRAIALPRAVCQPEKRYGEREETRVMHS